MIHSKCLRGPTIALIALTAPSVAAQSKKPTPAEVVFREGREAVDRGDMETACAKFEEAVKLSRSPGPLLNFADCEERKGRLVSAEKHWKEGLEQLEAGDDRRAYAQERLASLAKRLPHLVVRVKPSPKDAVVKIDGTLTPGAETGASVAVDPGAHKIEVNAGEQHGQAEVSVAQGDQKEVTVSLESARGTTVSPDKRSSSLRTVGFISTGVGVAGAIAFGVTAGLIQRQHALVDSGCDAQKLCTQEGLDAALLGKTLMPINAAAFVVGIVGLGVGVTLIAVGSSNKKPAVGLQANANASSVSASIVGTF